MKDPLWRGWREEFVYFVHSYYVVPSGPGAVALDCEYGERVLRRGAPGQPLRLSVPPGEESARGPADPEDFVELGS
jgi:hypothetical protein